MFWYTKQSWGEGTKLKVFALFVLLVHYFTFLLTATASYTPSYLASKRILTENTCAAFLWAWDKIINFFYRLLSVISLEPCEFLKISTSDYARVIQVTLNIILKHSTMACCFKEFSSCNILLIPFLFEFSRILEHVLVTSPYAVNQPRC